MPGHNLVQTFDYSQISDTSVCPCTHPAVSCEEGKERNYWIEVSHKCVTISTNEILKF